MLAQVGINTDSPAPGALLDINSSDKGLLMTRVELVATDDYAPITPNATPTIGLLVYNTVTSSSGATQVTPGFYYWSGNEWRRFFNQGYTLNFTQSAEVIANSSSGSYSALTGLDSGFISVPFDGTYQIMFSGYYSTGTPVDTGFDAGSQGSLTLFAVDSGNNAVLLDEKYVASSSKVIDGVNFFFQSEHVTIIRNVDLLSTEQYRFRMFGREWSRQNANVGYYGKDSSGYTGSAGVNNAQRGEMTITLVKQN